MRIEGSKNDDNSEIIITVKCDMEGEFEFFNHHFQKMIQEMAEQGDALVIDPQNEKVYGAGTISEDEAMQTLKQFAVNSAVDANRQISPKLRNNFI